MKLFHVTPSRNKKSILRHGLLVSRARTQTRAVWLVSRQKVKWAVDVVRGRHGTRDVVVLYVNTKNRRYIGTHVNSYGFVMDIPPAQILGELAWEG